MSLVLEQLRDALAQDFTQGVRLSGNALGMGFVTATGHEPPLLIAETANGLLRISDGGELWSNMWMEGLVRPTPTPGELRVIRQLCQTYELQWDPKFHELFAVITKEEFTTVARHMLAATMFFDSWRALAPRSERAPAIQPRAIVKRVKKLAQEKGWKAVYRPDLEGKRTRRLVQPDLILTRRRRGTDAEAVVHFVKHREADEAMHTIVGWTADISHSLVFGVRENIAEEVRLEIRNAESFFEQRVATVPILKSGTEQLVLESARRLAA